MSVEPSGTVYWLGETARAYAALERVRVVLASARYHDEFSDYCVSAADIAAAMELGPAFEVVEPK